MKTEIRNLNATLGTYYPAFFDLYLNTDKSMEKLSITAMTDVERSAFFHEYIHFLQDVSTTTGLFNIYVINEYFRLVATQYATQNPFVLPVQLRNDNFGNVQLNQHINLSIFGERREYPYSTVVITKIKQEDKATALSKSKGINRIPTIKFESHNEWWEFGYKEIMESMAYILQRLCTKAYTSPEYPYLVAEKMAEFINSTFAKSLLNVLALCDVSLMTDQPGAYFVDYIQRITKEGRSIAKPEEIYDDFYSIVGVDCNGIQTSSLAHYTTLYNAAKQALKSYIAIPCIRQKLNKWIDMVFDIGYNIRDKYRYFFLELARDGDIMSNKTFNAIFYTIGSPLMHNNKGAYGRFPSHPSDYGDVSQYLLAILPIVESFNNGKTECYMKPFCISSGRKTDDRCKTPWLKKCELRLCPVATIWKHRKLAANRIEC